MESPESAFPFPSPFKDSKLEALSHSSEVAEINANLKDLKAARGLVY